MKPIVGLLKCSYLCSINQYLVPNISYKNMYCKKCGSKYSTMNYHGVKLSDAARNYKRELSMELNKSGLSLVDYNSEYALIMSLIFILNNRIEKRDLDNLIKLTQDAIYEYFKIDDVNIYELHVMKTLSNSDNEYVKFIISQSPKKLIEYKI